MSETLNYMEFITKIFAQRNSDEVVGVSRPMRDVDQDSPPWWTTGIDDRRFLDHAKTPDEWYFCVGTLNGERTASGRGYKRGRKNITRLHCLVLDDVGSKADDPPVEPCWIMETSQGNYQWGYTIEPCDDLELYEACVAWCARQGWTDAGAGGAYRVMRLPGSVNTKHGRGRWQSVLRSFDLQTTPLMDLMQAFGCDLSASELVSLNRNHSKFNIAAFNGERKDDIDPVTGWLADAGHLLDDADGDWLAVTCPNAAAHSNGAAAAYYSPLGAGDPAYVQTRNFKCHHAHCTDLDTKSYLKWVADQGGPKVSSYDPLPWLRDRYVVVAKNTEIIDRVLAPYGEYIYTPKEICFRHPQRVVIGDQPMTVDRVLVQDQQIDRVDRLSYRPGAPEIFEQDGQPCFNVFKPPFHLKTDRVPDLFLEHVRFLLPDETERECFLNWLAFKVQYPGKRSYAVVMVASGDFGVGRSSLGGFIRRIFGPEQVNTATLGQLIGRGKNGTQTFNDWMSRCQMVIVEEAKEIADDARIFHTGYEEFKVLVDNQPSSQRINPKYGRTYREHIYFNVLIFSNHVDAIVMPEGDRRIAVFRNPEKRQNKDYYDRLAMGLNDAEAAAAYWWLMRRDISGYDSVYPPDTEAKQTMIAETRSPSDLVYDHIVENYSEDLIKRKQLDSEVLGACIELGINTQYVHTYSKHIWRKLGSLRPGEKHGYRLQEDGERQEVRAIRNKKEYLSPDA